MKTLFLFSRTPLSIKKGVRRIADSEYLGRGTGDNGLSLPILEGSEAQQVVLEFKHLVTRMSQANADQPAWWYTWLSSRDRHNSCMLDSLALALRFSKFLDQVELGAPLYWICQDPEVAVMVKNIAMRHGWQVQSGILDRLVWSLRYLVIGVKGFRRALVRAASTTLLVHKSREAGWPTEKPTHADVAIISIIHQANLQKQAGHDSFHDTYLGDLPKFLTQRGEQVILCGIPGNKLHETIRAAQKITAIPLFTYGHFLTYWEVLQSFWKGLTVNIKIPEITFASSGDVRALIRWDLRRRAASDIIFGFSLEYASRRLFREYPNCRVIHMYENNPWERAVDWAAKCSTPPRDVTGFHHCAVLECHVKNYIAVEEKGLRPGPSRIVSTGEEARTIFLSLGH